MAFLLRLLLLLGLAGLAQRTRPPQRLVAARPPKGGGLVRVRVRVRVRVGSRVRVSVRVRVGGRVRVRVRGRVRGRVRIGVS
jgi:hypothetical protein